MNVCCKCLIYLRESFPNILHRYTETGGAKGLSLRIKYCVSSSDNRFPVSLHSHPPKDKVL